MAPRDDHLVFLGPKRASELGWWYFVYCVALGTPGCIALTNLPSQPYLSESESYCFTNLKLSVVGGVIPHINHDLGWIRSCEVVKQITQAYGGAVTDHLTN